MKTIQLRPYQQECLNEISKRDHGAYLCQMATGLGKCLGRGTKVLMADGHIKNVEDILEGERVMGPDSKPRTVMSLARGREEMFRVIPVKGEPYIVNRSHILSLKITGMGRKRLTGPNGKIFHSGDVCNLSIDEYQKTSSTFRHCAKGWRTGVDFQGKETAIPPYILGVWLADGTTTSPNVTTMDVEVVRELQKYSSDNGLTLSVVSSPNTGKALTYSITSKGNRTHGANTFRVALKEYGLTNGKYIPYNYLTSNRQTRLELLAGVLDGDGYFVDGCYEIATARKEMSDGILYLARSLGFAAYMSEKQVNGSIYYRIDISGDLSEIPLRVERRKASPRRQKKNVLVTGIKVEPIGEGEYFGFELSGNDRLFVLGDFTVTHNTVTFSCIPREGRMLILSHREELVHQPLKYFDCATGVEMAGEHAAPMAEVVSASVQTLTRRLSHFASNEFDVLVCDEAHHAAAASYRRIFDHFTPRLHVGFTATPCRSDKVRLDDVYQDIIFERDLKWGIKAGYLSDIYCRRVNIGYDLSNVRTSHGDYAPGELDEAMDGTADAVAEAYRDLARGATLIFAASVHQAQEIAARIPGAAVVTGETKNRADIIAAFTRREIPCLVNCMVFTEGTDIPLIETIIIARPTQSDTLYTQMVGRGLRPAPGKDKLNLIDCVGIAGRRSLCTAPSLLGIDLDSIPARKQSEIVGDLFDLPEKAIRASDCPESWVKNVQIVDLWAAEQQYNTHDVNYFKMPDGSLVLSLPERQKIVIPAANELGRVTIGGKQMRMQEALDSAYKLLCDEYEDSKVLWDKNAVERWGRAPATEKQLALIKRRCRDFDCIGVTKGQASMILNRLFGGRKTA